MTTNHHHAVVIDLRRELAVQVPRLGLSRFLYAIDSPPRAHEPLDVRGRASPGEVQHAGGRQSQLGRLRKRVKRKVVSATISCEMR